MTGFLARLSAPPAEPPIDIDREAAAEQARRELAGPDYRPADSVLDRAVDEVLDWISDLLAGAAVGSPDGRTGLVILLAVVGLAVVVVRRAGLLRLTRSQRQTVFGSEAVRRAAEYRAEAEAHAAAGRFGPAVRSRFHACVAELTERTVLDGRPGRTAYEVAADAGAAIPGLAGPLGPAAQAFVEVVYGGRPGTADRYAAVLGADRAAREVSTRSLVHAPGAPS